MSIFNFNDSDALGHVRSVDTATVIVRVDDVERLRKLQVNRLAVLQSSRPGQHLIGIIQKITRSAVEAQDIEMDVTDENTSQIRGELNLVRISLIGTMADRIGQDTNIFLRTLETVPEIEANCFALEGETLTDFMRVIANIATDGQRLSLGRYTMDDKAEAYLNGNKFFQRHAIIVGSTGSGKSWTTARILERLSLLENGNAIVFDIHGEYGPLQGTGIAHLRIAGPKDIDDSASLKDGVIFLPYWLLGYEAMISMFVDRSDQNAPNQSMVMSRAIVNAKRDYLEKGKHYDVLKNFTIDSPIPFSMQAVIGELEGLNAEKVEGSTSKGKQGDFHGKLSRLIQRLQNKQTDRRLGFLFQCPEDTMEFGWLEKLASTLVAGLKDQINGTGGIKIVDFSDVVVMTRSDS